MYGNNVNSSSLSTLVRTAGLVGFGAGSAEVSSAVLPNTGGNIAIHILSYATIGLGILILASYIITRIVTRNKTV